MSEILTPSEQLTQAYPPLASRGQKELWSFTKPQTFARTAVQKEAELSYTGEHFKHKLAPQTLHRGSHKRVFMAGENALIVESVFGDGQDSLLKDTCDLTLEAGAKVTHLRLHVGSDTSNLHRTVNVTLDADATYTQFTLTAGHSISRAETFITTIGEGAHAEVTSLSLLHDTQQANIVNHTTFSAPNCTANIRTRNIVNNAAQAIFQGKFHVDQIAQKTDAYMLCQNILLAETARATHKPELEIYADDVKCSHGATTGTLDEDHIFYLQARGIPKDVAINMLITAHIEDLIDELDESLQTFVRPHAESWLAEITHHDHS